MQLPDLIDVIAGLDPAISFYKFRHNGDYRVEPDNDTKPSPMVAHYGLPGQAG